jgi:FAD/FMN-containing dehydrogenase
MARSGNLNHLETLSNHIQGADIVFSQPTNVFWSRENVDTSGVNLNRSTVTQIVEVSPENQVVTVGAGITLAKLNQELSKHGLIIPFLGLNSEHLEIGQLIEQNSPHLLQAQHGTWRDWVTGLRLILADGSIVKSGAQVVKNVTGFDLHKLVIGSRGTLGVTVEMTLRALPIASVMQPDISGVQPSFVSSYQRVKRSDWSSITEIYKTLQVPAIFDHAACQVFSEGEVSTRFDEDVVWTMRGSFGSDPTVGEVAIMKRLKALFDPSGKLNPGEFRFL